MSVYVPFSSAESEFTEKKSRFITHIWRISSEEEALTHIKEMKAKYYDARHNTYCYVVNKTVVRYSDDGEPQGTAGQPMLKVFEREHVEQYCCVVTRYFGGILLGAGGLTRAYAKGAKDGLIASGIAELVQHTTIEILISYADLDRVNKDIESCNGKIIEKSFNDKVKLKIIIVSEHVEQLKEKIINTTAGKACCSIVEISFLPGQKIEFA